MDMGGLNFPHQPPPESWNGGRIERIDIETRRGGRPLRGVRRQPAARPERHRLRRARRLLVHRPRRPARAVERPHRHLLRAARRLGIREAIFPMDAPNGIGLSPDGSRLYVAETFANTCWWWKVTGPGEVEEVPGVFPHGGTLLYSPGGLQGFDSLGVDGEGHVCLATLVNGGISVVDGESGELVGVRPDRRHPHDEHLLRGRGPEDGVRHAVRDGPAGVGRVGLARARARALRIERGFRAPQRRVRLLPSNP